MTSPTNESFKPKFLSAERFNTIPIIHDRLYAQARREGGSSILGDCDVLRSVSFSLFGKKGAFTGFHTDCPAGTWAHALSGRKLWIFPVASASLSDFEKHGEAWAPKVRVVLLEAGDTLVMTEPTPHAVLTLEDSWMIGGMFIDIENMLVLMEKLIWMADNQNVTNEPVPTELLKGWTHVQRLFNNSTTGQHEHHKKQFTKMERRLKLVMSCRSTCKGKCGGSCKCKVSDVTAKRCNSGCQTNVKRACCT